MALTVAELNAVLTADTKDFQSGMKKAGDDADGFGSKLSSGIGTMAKWGAAAAAAGVSAAVAFGVKAVNAASDMNEAISKVDTVFKASGPAIQAWSKTTASSIGISRTEALGAVGAFGNMFDQLGIGSQKAATMSTKMVELAADFASFHNADITEVLNAQQAAFRGEYDSLQRFLPLINAASVEQKAMAMTGKANKDALTQQEKALAVNALMMEGAGQAAGDFQRTSGGLANQMRILKAQAADFAANAGQMLIPIVLKGIQLFRDLAGQLSTLVGPAFQAAKDMAGQVGAAFRTLADGDVVGFAKRIDEVFGGGGAFVKPIVTAVDTVKQAFDTVKKAISGFVDSFSKNSDDAGTTAGKLMGIFNQIKDVAASAFGAIQAIITTVIDFVRGVWRVFGDDILSFARESWNGILEVVRGALNTLGGIFDLIKAVLSGKWGDAWNALKAILDGAWDTIFGVVRNAVTNVIPTILAGLGQIVASIGRTVWDGLKEPLKGVLNWAIGAFETFANVAIQALTSPIGVLNKIPGVKNVIPDVPKVSLPRFHQGGVVPGPRGADVPIMAQAGERVIPAGAAMGGGIVINVTAGVGDPVEIGRQVQAVLLQLQRRTGSLGFA